MVYVAGPISSDPIGHSREAIARYLRMIGDGVVVPFCPHLSVLAEMMGGPVDYELWLRHDFEVIEKCDALLRTKGDSPGADREVEFARANSIPVFMTQGALYAWADQRHAWRKKASLSTTVDL